MGDSLTGLKGANEDEAAYICAINKVQTSTDVKKTHLESKVLPDMANNMEGMHSTDNCTR